MSLSNKPGSNKLAPDNLDLLMLVCPRTHAPLRYDGAAQELLSDEAKLAYPIRDAIPILLPAEAREI